ncbi:MAG: methionine gamma-lyase family protein [Clostridia bacterium]|nr:methionine gamma-lyase family protein [Clostridia bacterium]
MNIPEKILNLTAEAEAALAPAFAEIDKRSFKGTVRVLEAFKEERVSEAMFAPTTGYGYGDVGRDAADRICARIFGAEAAFIRPSILSGTHAITVGLFGLLRPGDVMLSVTNAPYDTLHDVIGIKGANGTGSLADFGVHYDQVDMTPDGKIDVEGAKAKLAEYGDRVRVIFIQRSKGYLLRRSLSSEEIGEAARALKAAAPKAFVVVDNCYGEFTCDKEPCALGADMIIGSLIKNIGGGMADIGGYVAGTAEAVELAGYRLTCPGVGLEVGASLGQTRNILKGLFYAPHTTAQALKVAHLTAYIFDKLGYEVAPAAGESRNDIIQTVTFRDPEAMVKFCRGIQFASPIDSHVSPEPWDMPGYDDPVVMAAGAFTGGSSIELSADGPMRDPYTAFMQGGLTYESGRYGIMCAAAYCIS